MILVDLDLRFPSLERLFILDGYPGVTDVVLDHVPLDRALGEIQISNGSADESLSVLGSLHVLTAGPVSPELREAITVDALATLLEQIIGLAIDAEIEMWNRLLRVKQTPGGDALRRGKRLNPKAARRFGSDGRGRNR